MLRSACENAVNFVSQTRSIFVCSSDLRKHLDGFSSLTGQSSNPLDREMQSKTYTIAELFSGCGGFTNGFLKSGRFTPVLANDIKGAALATYRHNNIGVLGEPEIINKDLRQVKAAQIEAALNRKGLDRGELDVLVGGPPCQGFSQLRRGEEREGGNIVKFRGYDRLAHDPRNDLVLRFLEVAEVLRPRFIVIENVPQFLRHGFNGSAGGLVDAIHDLLQQDMGYRVAVAILNAADFGIPQARQRAFILASRDGRAAFPNSTHASPEELDPLDKERSPWLTVAEALSDLPPPPVGKDLLGGGPITLYRSDRGSAYGERTRSKKRFPYNHVTRKYSHDILGIIEEMRPGETWDHASGRMRDHYDQLVASRQRPDETVAEARDRLIDGGLINPRFYKSYYWSAYTRLAWDKPALTITANANFLGSGRFTHPEENRGITMREAARLQSFEDDFRFITSASNLEDTETIGVGLDMIGEAVPPLLSCAIAKQIAYLLDGVTEGSRADTG